MSDTGPDTEVEFQQYIFSNDLSDVRLPGLLDMFYRGVLTNTIGLMVAKDVELDIDALLLVGLEQNEDGGVDTYPLARILDPAELKRYRSPDGTGGYFD